MHPEGDTPALNKYLVTYRRGGEKYEQEIHAVNPERAEWLLHLDKPDAEAISAKLIGSVPDRVY